MMELRIYDRDLDFKGICENQTSFVWTRKFFTCGEFSIHAPLTDSNVKLFNVGNLVTYRGANEAGVIEDLTFRMTSQERVIVAYGRFLPSYMDRRLVRPRLNFNGKVEDAMRSMLANAVAIPNVYLGEYNNFPETVEFQATYKNLLTMEEKLSKGFNIGFRFRPNFTEKKIYFELYKGVDKSVNNGERAFVEFSDRFDNLTTVEKRKCDQLYKNVGYVGGEGEGSQRVYVQVGDNSLTGLDRRELFIDAKDINSEDLTQSEYIAALSTRGNEKLNEHTISDSYDTSTVPEGNFKYRTDYDLGDIVTIRKTDWGLSENLRITEIQEVYEHGTMVVVPTFGVPLPTKIDLEDK